MAATYEWGDELPTLKAQGLDLGPLQEQDLGALFEIFGDPEVMRYFGFPRLHDASAARVLLDDIRRFFYERRLFQWGVRRTGTLQVIGTCTLFNLDVTHRRAEIGFAVARSEWGQGVATKATAGLISFAFEKLNLHRLEADADPRNGASLRVLERNGFQREGCLRQRYHQDGEVQDAVVLGLLKSEWRGSPFVP